MLDLIQRDLQFHAPQVVAAFGGADSMLEVLLQRYPENYQIDLYLHHLLTSSEIKVLSPLNPQFNLYQAAADLLWEPGSILRNEPYEIYSTEGDLLYRVANHQGVFGRSLLDQALLLSSQQGDLYYLRYPTEADEKLLLILINLNRSLVKKPLGLKGSSQSISSVSQISLKVVNALRDLNQTGLPLFPITLRFRSISSTIPTRDALLDASAIQETYALELGSNLVFYPKTAGWFALTQKTQSGTQFLKVTGLSGTGVDQFKEVSEGLYYIALGDQPGTQITRQALNIPRFDQTLNLQANITL